MIKVRITKAQSDIVEISVKGHADSDEYGKDLVCASVSAITFGLCNAMDTLTDVNEISIKDNHIKIHVEKPDFETNTILNTGLIQLRTVQEKYPEYIEIKITEV